MLRMVALVHVHKVLNQGVLSGVLSGSVKV